MELKWGQIIRFFTIRLVEGIIVLLLIMFMPNIPPYCKISDPISISPAQPLTGKLAMNERLNDLSIWHKGDLLGPESFADYNGELYCSLQTGEIVKLIDNDIKKVVQFGRPCKGLYQEKICGRPLGIQFDKDGHLFAIDAYYGIFRVNIKTGEKVQLVSNDTEIDGKLPKLMNGLAVASNGDIYWTHSSTEFHLEDGLYDLFSDGSGRLIHYDSKTKQNKVLMDNLLFSNGVALSDDEEFVLVTETGRSRVHRYYIRGPKKGTSEVFLDGLPGLPDNINSDGQGGFFFPLIVARDDYTPVPNQILSQFPLLRKLVARMMALAELGFSIANKIYQHEYFERGMHLIGHFSVTSYFLPSRVSVIHVSKAGEILGSLHANNRKAMGISEAYIFKSELFLGSPFNDFIARIPLSKVGLEHLEKKSRPQEQAKEIPTTTTTPAPKTTKTTTTAKPTTTSAPSKAPTTTTTTTTTTTPPPKPTTKPPTKAPAQKKETVAPKPTEPPKVKPAETQKAAPKTESAKSTQPPQAAKQEAKPIQSNKQQPKSSPPTTKQETKAAPQEKKTASSPNNAPK